MPGSSSEEELCHLHSSLSSFNCRRSPMLSLSAYYHRRSPTSNPVSCLTDHPVTICSSDIEITSSRREFYGDNYTKISGFVSSTRSATVGQEQRQLRPASLEELSSSSYLYPLRQAPLGLRMANLLSILLLHLIETLVPYPSKYGLNPTIPKLSASYPILTCICSMSTVSSCSSFFRLQQVSLDTVLSRSELLIRLNRMLHHQTPLS